jgi:hypothetical protein
MLAFIRLTYENKMGRLDFASRGGARVSQTNSFTLKNVGDGTYRVEVEGESKVTDCLG